MSNLLSKAFYVCCLLCVLSLSGCSSNSGQQQYSQFFNPGKNVWNHLEVFCFSLDENGRAYVGKQSDVVLTLRHTDECDVASLPIVIVQRTSDTEEQTDTIELKLADANGVWLGKGYYGIHTLTKKLRNGFPIPENYEILIKPAFEKTTVRGISDIGISLATPETRQ